jgi:group I intron endonuclease
MITYCAIHLPTKKFYVGSTTNFESRYAGHTKGNSKYPFQRTLEKDSKNFYWIVSESDSSNDRQEEQYYLDFWYGHRLCWNLKKQAGGGYGWDHVNKNPDYKNPHIGAKRSEETRQKMRDAKPKGVYSNKGKTSESRLLVTMTNIDGRVETHPNWKWREMEVRWDRAGILRSHDKGWQKPYCPLDQTAQNLPTE